MMKKSPRAAESIDLVQIYKCLCDRTRLRILNLLKQGPLCVCHFQDLLSEPQVKVSKHLAYLRKHSMVQAERAGNKVIYSLPLHPPPELETNLKCLQDCAQSDREFRNDLKRLSKALRGGRMTIKPRVGPKRAI